MGHLVAQSVKQPTLDFGSGNDLRVLGASPALGYMCMQGVFLRFSPSPFAPPLPTHTLPHFLKKIFFSAVKQAKKKIFS